MGIWGIFWKEQRAHGGIKDWIDHTGEETMMDSGHQVWVRVGEDRFLVRVEDLNQNPVVAFVDGCRYEVSLDESEPVSQGSSDANQPQQGVHSIPADTRCEITAPMPGDIVEINVREGQSVSVGDPLCVLDAMKMKNIIHAPQAGKVARICVQEGQAVDYGTPLVSLE
jgi:biotin carboxyl carrier protein